MNRHKHLKKWFCIVLCVAFGLTGAGGVAFAQETAEPVSYTHLDVYKRQAKS